MSVVANVAINVDARGAERALKGLAGATDALERKFQALPNKIGGALQGLGGKIQGLGSQLTNLGSVMAGIGASAAVGGFVKAGIEAERTRKTIKALADQHGETAKITAFANQAADKFGIGQTQAAKAVADLYGRLRPMGISLSDIQKTFTGVNNAAALMNLTAADTDGVMLQLSQALGSGALQGDEFRSVMERLPAIGQAIARTMGVPVSQLKELSSEGKLTTDVVLRAMDELTKIQPPPPDAYKLFQKVLADLSTTIGDQLMPVFTPLVQRLAELVKRFEELKVGTTIAQALKPIAEAALAIVNAFLLLDPNIQKAIIQVGVLAGAFALIAAPLGFAVVGIGKLISAAGAVVGSLGGVAAVVGKIIAILGTLGKVAIAIFSGPAGWIALAVAAGVAIYAFRDQIADAFKAIGQTVINASKWFKDKFIDPVIKWNTMLYDGMVKLFSGLAGALRAPFQAVASMIKGVVNGIINIINAQISAAINAINSLIRSANVALSRLRLPQIPQLPVPQIPRFAEGGVVTRPTLALVGEGGEPEYIVPHSKAGAFAQNWISGSQPAGQSMSAGPINIQTGPVMQQDGKQYVTIGDLEKSLQVMANAILGNSRSAGGRRFAGVS